MIGFNGGLIGINRTYGATAASPGVWTLDETLPTKRKVVASGGNSKEEITDPVDGFIYILHSFTSTGDTSFIVAQGGVVEYLIIGGGSGGNTGTAFVNYGNGGAAGVARTGNATVAAQTYTITVGTGSVGPATGNSSAGGNSIALGVTATGGNGSSSTGRTGASNADFSGGTNSASFNSGGGAGAGANGSSSTGGAGFSSTFTGSTVVRGGGGGGVDNGVGAAGGAGGGGAGADGNGVDGTDNTGSGGGGASGAGGFTGGDGGSGVVFIRYRK
jgi:hypothetical protein